jgi:hypothetical protein
MDAIFVASIIICVLVRLSAILALSITLLALVLLVVLLILGLVHPPKARTHAHLF